MESIVEFTDKSVAQSIKPTHQAKKVENKYSYA